MSNALRMAAGAAAVVVAGLVAITLLPDQPPDVGTQTPAPTSSPLPSPEVLSAEGPLSAGTYVTNPVFPVRVAFTVPAGWTADVVGSALAIVSSERSSVGFWLVDEAPRDPCGLGGVVGSPVGPTAADLAAALAAAPGFDSTGPVDTAIGGVAGKYVELLGPLPGCTDPELWRTPNGDCRCMESAVERNRLWIVDVGGNRLVVDILAGGDTPIDSAALAEIERIVDSIQISR